MINATIRGIRAALAAGFLALSSLHSPAFAQEGETVSIPNGTSDVVFAYNRCYVVGNSTSWPILVPLGSVSEWWGPDSFIANAGDVNGINLRRCETRWDIAICRTTHQDETLMGGDFCNNSFSFRIFRVRGGAESIPSGAFSGWANAVSWASSNLGRPVSARPSDVLPACYTNSSMTSLTNRPSYSNWLSGDTVYDHVRSNGLFIPSDSDFCIAAFSGNGFMGSGGQAGRSEGFIRIWRN